MREFCFIIALLILLTNMSLSAQPMRIDLPERSTTDDEMLHVTPFTRQPKETLRFPEIDTTGAWFFEIFYSWDINDDQMITVMVMQKDSTDILYIDRNNDEDLTNDGSPYYFPQSHNDFIFDIVAKDDPEQIAQNLLQLKPVWTNAAPADSIFFDETGNLKTGIAMGVAFDEPHVTGAKGTFYIDDRVALRRGKARICSKNYEVGLFDWNNNGLFNDAKEKDGDLFAIDLDGDGKMSFHNQYEFFALDDVVKIDKQNYKLRKVDPYGAYVEIEPTNKAATFYYLNQLHELQAEHASNLGIEIEASFWALGFETLDGKAVKPADYEGRFFLLNFWGEWCKPCIEEIPELAYAAEHFSDKLEIISFLKTGNLEKAREVIEKYEMNWLHVLLDEKIEKQLKISGYPTNILISPHRKVLFSTHQINRKMLEKMFSEYAQTGKGKKRPQNLNTLRRKNRF